MDTIILSLMLFTFITLFLARRWLTLASFLVTLGSAAVLFYLHVDQALNLSF